MRRTLLSDAKAKSNTPLIVELVGVAGSGKTSVASELYRHGRGIARGNFPDIHDLKNVKFFLVNGIALIPLLLRLRRASGQRLTRRQAAWMMILTGWPALLRRDQGNDTSVIVVDQGAIYMLTELHSFGPECLRSRDVEWWWDRTYSQWARTLDLVVWLDAPNGILIERIQRRHRGHWVENRPEREVVQFLNQFRAGYEYVIGRLAAINKELKVLKIDTARASEDVVLGQILSQVWSEKQRVTHIL